MPTYLDELIKKAKELKAEKERGEPKKPAKKRAVPELKDAPEEIQRELFEPKAREGIQETGKEIAPIEETPEPEEETPGIEEKMKRKTKQEIDSYGDVKIYRVKGDPLSYYFVPVRKPTSGEKTMISTIKEAATRIISIAPYRIRDPEQRRNVYKQKVLEILHSSSELNIPERRYDFYAESVVREMVGYGIIDPLVRDDQLEEIMVIGPHKPVYVFHRKYEMMKTNIEFFSDNEITDLINRIAREVGRRVDISAPLLDARLLDGSRVNATIPPASISGATLTIRKFRKDPYSIVDLISFKTCDAKTAAFLWMAVDGLGVKPANMLITGGTGSGKTTTLNVLASFIPARERIVTIEDTAELSLPLSHFISLEAKPPGIEGTGEITLDILTKNSLRMRPDRIIVGEVRHDEAFSLFTAMNTGHDGATTGDSLIQFSDGSIEEIGEFAEREFKKKAVVKEGKFEFIELGKEIMVPSLNKQTLKIEDRPVTRVWRKKTKQKMAVIKTRSGKTIKLTPDHPIYRINHGIQEISAKDAAKGDFIAFPKEIQLRATETITQPYLAGLIYGDGHVHSEGIHFVNKEKTIVQNFVKEIKKSTENKVSCKDFGNFSRANVFDKELVKKLVGEYNIPMGNKTKIFKIGSKTLSAKNPCIGRLLSGLFDADAHVNQHSNSVQFSTSNKDLAKKLPMILQRFGIHSSTNVQEKDSKGNIGPYYRISIYGKDNLKRFREGIGFGHAAKKQRLDELISVSKNSKDLFPGISRLIKRARNDALMTQTELASLMNTKTRSTVEAYETNQRNPSRKQLEKIARMTLGTAIGNELLKLAESDLRFEEIVEAREEEFEGYVYDLTVKDNHNYIANGLFVSNCMGTVHANSPQETVVRVTSPPMNVPEIMMSGLDLIVVEHRIHDKRKGTIRRLTEIAEVSGALEGKTITKTLFERDPVEDTMTRTNVPSAYLAILQKFTGYTKKQMDNELGEREEFLKELVKKNIRSLREVSKRTQKYFAEKGKA